MKPGWDDYSTYGWTIMPNTVVANNIEMIGRQYRQEPDGTWQPTNMPSIRYWGVTGPEGGVNPVLLSAVKQAIERHDLTRSTVSNFFVGDGMPYPAAGKAFVNFISHNVFQFTEKDTPDTVMRSDLDKSVNAFADILSVEDNVERSLLYPAVNVPLHP